MSSHYVSTITLLAAPVVANAHGQNIACFTHTVQNKANSIRFAHQLLCSPRILMLLKAMCCGFLKGCPNLAVVVVTKYLNPSLATAKYHMKRPGMGIQSTQCIDTLVPITAELPDNPPKFKVLSHDSSIINFICPPNANLIETDDASPTQTYFVSLLFQTNKQAYYTMTLLGRFPSCLWKATCVFSLYITTKPTQF